MLLYWPVKAIWHIFNEIISVGPCKIVEFVVIYDSRFAFDYIAGYINHHSTGVWVDAFTENYRLNYDKTGFLTDFAYRCVACGLAWFDFAAGELPGQAAFLDTSAHEQDFALVRDDR